MDNHTVFPPTFPANIYKGHGRNHAAFLFMRWNTDDEGEFPNDESQVLAAREFINSLNITNYARQKQQKKDQQELLISLVLSYKGFTYLGIKEAHIPKSESKDKMMFKVPMMYEGLREKFHDYDDDVDDSKQNKIDKKYMAMKQNIHSMLIIAHADKNEIESEIERIKNSECYKKVVKSSFCEYGEKFTNSNEDALDPLDFVDNISNEQDPAKIWKMVSFEEPVINESDEVSYGSFFVFRKIEVHTTHFEKMVGDLEEKLEGDMNSDEKKSLARALYMGRFQNGTPVVKFSKQSTSPKDIDNDFQYSDPLVNFKCPVNAHIRAVNGRYDSQHASIIRRSMTYTEKRGNEETPVKGIFFMSYQRDLLQLTDILAEMERNKDAIVYRPPLGAENIEMDIPVRWGNPESGNVKLPIGGNNLTTFRGGEWFFAPSTTFIEQMLTMPVEFYTAE